MKKILILIWIILLSSIVYAECEQKSTFKERLQDRCSYNNTICEDAENIFSSDCRITTESITCKGDRCIFKELWFAKLMLIVLAFMMVSSRRDNNLFIALIAIILIFNFSNLSWVDNIKSNMINIAPTINTSSPYIPQEYINDNIAMRYGQKILPSNPMYGFIIILIIMFFTARYVFRRWL